MYVRPSDNDDSEEEMRETEGRGKGEGNRVKKEGGINEWKQQENNLKEEGILEYES